MDDSTHLEPSGLQLQTYTWNYADINSVLFKLSV